MCFDIVCINMPVQTKYIFHYFSQNTINFLFTQCQISIGYNSNFIEDRAVMLWTWLWGRYHVSQNVISNYYYYYYRNIIIVVIVIIMMIIVVIVIINVLLPVCGSAVVTYKHTKQTNKTLQSVSQSM